MDLLGDSDQEVDFTINQDYAKRYEKWRRGEEIQKLKDKYGDPEDSDSSTSEEEDEDGKELTKDVEKQFFKALSCLKEKNPKIYDQNVRFFEKKEEKKEEKNESKTKKNEPALTLAGYQRKVLLETGGQFSDKEEDNEEKQPFEMMSSEDQEKAIRQSFKNVLNDSDDEDEEQWGNMFTKRVKTEEELEKEEEDFRQWLAGEKDKVKDDQVKEELKGLHEYWTDPNLDEGEKFLRDYILNKRYLDHEDKNRIPSYDEIVHDSDSNLSADEETINKQDEFERKYNFRFEEPDREFIKRYPRTLEQSMRKKDERRKKHREEVKQRKQAERSKKDEELKRLKTLKKKEIMEKIEKLQHITGNQDIAFKSEDLEGDFDPDEYDKRMSQIFNEDYYGTGGDEEKPEFPEYDEELDIENWDDWAGPEGAQEVEELHCEDPGFNMDCDYDPKKKKEHQNELIENSRRRKKRRKSKFAEALEKEKPVFDPKDKTFEQYVDEYYSLDYEDLIGDIPCRFKYRKVLPNDFGLSIEEILNASDQELNRWVSLKKITRRLPEHVERYDVQAYKRKASNFHKKAKCFPSLYGPKVDDSQPQHSSFDSKNNQIKTQGKKREESVNNFEKENLDESANLPESEPKGKKRKKKRKAENELSLDIEIKSGDTSQGVLNNDEIGISVNLNKKKKKKRKNSGGEEFVNNETENQDTVCDSNEIKPDGIGKKKKKKNKLGKEVIKNVSQEDTVPVDHDEARESTKNKRKNKLKQNKIQQSFTVEHIGTENNIEEAGSENMKKKKKKMRKPKSEDSLKELEVVQNNVQVGKKAKKRNYSVIEEKSCENMNGKKEGKNHKKRKFNNQQRENENLCNLSDERLKSYGLNPKKYKNKLKYRNKNK
ncbi:UNVERIFIED_CONTAM: hypothetical protein PYX00_000116 [Menopon gallinae]|uniref:Protein KRI1 homolog n=1 Tax=Menopon gallinae TaxID=328185 RepID=A0AAW2I8S8_9NEOP